MPKLHELSLGHPDKKEPNFLLSGKLTPSLCILNGNFSISSLIMLLRIYNLYYVYCLYHFVATIIVFISKLPYDDNVATIPSLGSTLIRPNFFFEFFKKFLEDSGGL